MRTDGAGVIIGALLIVGFVSVPLRGGRLGALTELRLRLIGVAVAAFAVQVLVVNIVPAGSRTLHAAVLVATYGVLAVVVVANWRVPGLVVTGVGGLLNALAIVANGGVMPAAAGALRMAGMDPQPSEYTNSALVAHPHLGFLGDAFAVPSWVPAANVFSVGDLLIVAGAWILLHRVCRRPRFAVAFFEQVAASPHSVLLRLGAVGGEGVELVVDDGSRAHRVAPLPGAGGALGFVVPAALLGARARFAAVLDDRLVDLPAPRAVTIR